MGTSTWVRGGVQVKYNLYYYYTIMDGDQNKTVASIMILIYSICVFNNGDGSEQNSKEM
jgi:hypothetical protein